MRKTVTIFCLLFTLLMNVCPPISASESGAEILKPYELYGESNTDPDKNYKENEDLAAKKLKLYETFKKEVQDLISTKSSYYGVFVPYCCQETSYWCGPATGLQTLYNWGRESYVPNNPTKQAQLAIDMGTTTSGTNIYMCRDGINKYLPSSWYASTIISNNTSSKDCLKNYSIMNYNYGHSVVYLVIKNKLSYYAGTLATGHYISGAGYLYNGSYSTDMIDLTDCNSSAPYAGSHRENFGNVFEALYTYYNSRGVANFLW